MRGVMHVLQSIIQIAKIFLVISFAMFCPRLFLFYAARSHAHLNYHDPSFKLGLENITDATKDSFLVRGHKPVCALITNQSGVDQSGVRNVDILLKHNVSIKKIVFPVDKTQTHITGATTMMQEVGTSMGIDFLYRKKNQICSSVFDDVEAIVFDVPDISLSHTAFYSVLRDVFALAGHKNKPVIILDRPNLFGSKVEGAVMQNAMHSGAIPFRSGMTVGELSLYMNKQLYGSTVDVRVVPMCNYTRSASDYKELLACLSRMELPACMSSGTSFLGLMAQVAPFDVGIGTDHAFECLLLPESVPFAQQKWHELQIVLRNNGIESKFIRTFCGHKKEYMSGLRFNMHSMRDYSTTNTLLCVLTFFKDHDLKMHFSACFDATVGTPMIREVVQGVRNQSELKDRINADLRAFFNKAREAFIYAPLPELLCI